MEKKRNDSKTLRAHEGNMISKKKRKQNFLFGQCWNDFNVLRKVDVSAAHLARPVSHQDKFFALAGWCALHHASRWGSIEIVQLVFDRVQSPDPLTDIEETPLCLASKHNSPDVGKRKLYFRKTAVYNTFVFLLHSRRLWKTQWKSEKSTVKF